LPVVFTLAFIFLVHNSAVTLASKMHHTPVPFSTAPS